MTLVLWFGITFALGMIFGGGWSGDGSKTGAFLGIVLIVVILLIQAGRHFGSLFP